MRRKTTLISIAPILLLLFTLCYIPATSGRVSVINVPEDYPTIQEAVDAASPHTIIRVGPGVYAGAIIDKPLKLIGDDAKIMMSFVGFELLLGSDGTEIRGFDFMYNFIGIWANFDDDAGLDIDHVKVSDNYFTGSLSAIVNTRGDHWIITKNTIDGFLSMGFPFAADGIRLGGHYHLVMFNDIKHISTGGFLFAGISIGSSAVAPTTHCKVLANRIEVYDPDALICAGITVFDYSLQGGGPVTNTDNLIMLNCLQDSREMFFYDPVELEDYNIIKLNF